MKRRSLQLVFGSLIALGALPLMGQEPAVPAVVANLPAATQEAVPFMNQTYEKEWVVLDANNQVYGSLVQIDSKGVMQGMGGVSVSLSRNGTLIQSATTNNDGSFTFRGLGTGAYGLVAKSPTTVAAMGFHVLPQGASTVLDSKFTVYGTSIGPTAVMDVLRPNLVPGVSASYADTNVDPLGDARRFAPGHHLQLQAGGVINGGVAPLGLVGSRDLSGNVVSILRNGQLAARAVTNAAGEFQIAGLAAGVYDFLIAGKDGVAVGGFEAEAAPGVASDRRTAPKLVTTVSQASALLNVELIPVSDWYTGIGEQGMGPPGDLAPVPGAGLVGPAGMGGGGAGGGAGGGGAAGGGGLGGLLGVAGLAAGAVALGANDSGFVTPPATLVTP